MPVTPPINQSVAWAKLRQHQCSTRHLHMRDLFAQDPGRFGKMHETFNGMLVDFSKNRITEDTLKLLIELAETAQLRDRMDKMRRGDKINVSENRAVLHTALRLPENASVRVDGHDVVPDIHQALGRALALAEAVNTGRHTGARGDAITDVVNIGIGGSDLGPKMVTRALEPYRQRIRVHFVANIDGSSLMEVLRQVDAAKTLFVISSKSFITPETLYNARAARAWFLQQGFAEHELARHFVAVTNNLDAAHEFGMAAENVLPMFDWVGGRYSVWSAIGLPVMCAVGAEHFRSFLAGGRAMDEHFFSTPLRHNIPVLLGLIGLWYNTFYGAETHAVIPYSHDLRYLSAHLQQLDMESNGKQTNVHGERLEFDTGAVIWGDEGVNSQHAFFQLLHQGSRLIPCDFIVPANSHSPLEKQHQILVANALAQSQALMRGKTLAEAYAELESLDSHQRDMLAPQKVFPGNRPTNTIMIDALTPFNLGMLLAMYEHKVFVQGAVWGINSFDQWGVEYGKVLAKSIEPLLGNNEAAAHDASTNALIAYYREHHEYLHQHS
ncbi:glucose-6-phosphate isomerase [Neisseria sp. HSC-16F19]|nr:glucose-6-phosphate isomerase [Neisseria sp. HSC-16F19]MCP2040045.1 glucose-6-phosphate isomerase [Neisseria sp. HSC-16F19]